MIFHFRAALSVTANLVISQSSHRKAKLADDFAWYHLCERSRGLKTSLIPRVGSGTVSYSEEGDQPV